MEIHRYEKLWFAAALVLIVAFIATVTYGAVGAGISMIDDEGGEINPDHLFGEETAELSEEHERFAERGVFESDDPDIDYEAYIVARHPQFLPRVVEVPEGSTVQFYITAEDVIHSYDVVGTNVNTMVIPGQVAQFTVEFDDPETHGVICTEYCGSLHHEMEGELRVVDEDDWDEDEMLADGGED